MLLPNRVVVDTSIIIDYLRGVSTKLDDLNRLNLDGEILLEIPTLVVVELFAAEGASKPDERWHIENTIQNLKIIGLNYASSVKAGELLRRYKQIPDPYDLLIAAIAIEEGAQIATLNKKHFQEIKEVQIFKV